MNTILRVIKKKFTAVRKDDDECANIVRLFGRTCRNSGGCWEFMGGRKASGYGSFWYRGKVHSAHRVAWMIFKGDIPAKKLIMHKCDNRSCVNPDHLAVGTHLDNTTDMMQKGRHGSITKPERVLRGANHPRRKNPWKWDCKGEKNVLAKLTWRKVSIIRKLRVDGWTYKSIGLKFGVGGSTIHNVCSGETW